MGLQIYNTDSKCVETWNGQDWIMECGEHSSGRPYALGEVAYRISSVATAPITGRLRFATKNLGATISDIDPLLQIAAPEPFPDTDSSTDETIYGSLYQWGRYHDGHESRSSANYPTNDTYYHENGAVFTNSSDGQVPLSDAYGKFIKNDGSDYYHDWSKTPHDFLWGGNDQTFTIPHSKGVADPCPEGFRVPSQAEWAGIIAGVGDGGLSSPPLNTQTPLDSRIFLGVNKWQWVNGFSTPASYTSGFLIYPPTVDSDLNITGYQTTPTLFLPAAGMRTCHYGGLMLFAGDEGAYWSSTVIEANTDKLCYSMGLRMSAVEAIGTNYRADGLPVRCLGGVITY
jgi:uncharacterized protein (TIGR02145 family)